MYTFVSLATLALLPHSNASQFGNTTQTQTSATVSNAGSTTSSSNKNSPPSTTTAASAPTQSQKQCCFILGNNGPGFDIGVSANWFYQTTATQTVATIVQTLYQYPNSTSLGKATTQTIDSEKLFTDFGLFQYNGNQGTSPPIVPGIPTDLLPDDYRTALGELDNYAASSVYPANQTVDLVTSDSSTLTIPVGTPYNLWTFGVHTTDYSNGLCGTRSSYDIQTYADGSWSSVASTFNIPPDWDEQGPDDEYPNFVYVEALPGPQTAGGIFTLPYAGVSSFISSIQSQFPFVTGCYVPPANGEPTVHVAVDQLTVMSTVTTLMMPQSSPTPVAPTPEPTSPSPESTGQTDDATAPSPQPQSTSVSPGSTANPPASNNNPPASNNSPPSNNNPPSNDNPRQPSNGATTPLPDQTTSETDNTSNPQNNLPATPTSPDQGAPNNGATNPASPQPTGDSNTPASGDAASQTPDALPSSNTDSNDSGNPESNANPEATLALPIPSEGAPSAGDSQTVTTIIGGVTATFESNGMTSYSITGGSTAVTIVPAASPGAPSSEAITTVLGGSTAAFESNGSTYYSVEGGSTITTAVPAPSPAGSESETITTVINGTTIPYVSAGSTYYSIAGGSTVTAVVPAASSSGQVITAVVGGTTRTFTSDGEAFTSVLGGSTIVVTETSSGMDAAIMSGLGQTQTDAPAGNSASGSGSAPEAYTGASSKLMVRSGMLCVPMVVFVGMSL